MKASKILSNLSLSKIWGELTNLNENMISGFSSITTKINILEELVMSNAGTSEIYETARARIVNSALGKALGMTVDTQIIDAAVSIEGVKNNGAISKTITPSSKTVQTYTIPAGYHNGSGKVTVSKFTPELLGTLNGDGSIDCKSVSGYAGFNTSNFFLKDIGYKVVKSAWSYQTIGINATVSAPTLTYSNGVLTVSGLTKTWYIGKGGDSGDHNSYCTVTPNVEVYLIR